MNNICDNCFKFLAEKEKTLNRVDSIFDAGVDLINFKENCFKSCHSNPDRLYTRKQVAEVLCALFNDSCACNYNGIDEWLPLICDDPDTNCCSENASKTYCWEQYLKHFHEKDNLCENK